MIEKTVTISQDADSMMIKPRRRFDDRKDGDYKPRRRFNDDRRSKRFTDDKPNRRYGK